MKKTILLFVAVFGLFSAAIAQPTGMKAINKASRALSTFNLDQAANAEKLDQAKELMMTAFEDSEVQASSKAHSIKGNILAALANKTINAAILDPATAKGADMTTALQAYGAFQKGLELSVKKFEKKEALKGLVKVEQLLENMGIIAYQNQQWKDAYDSFQATLDASAALVGAGENSVVDAQKKQDIIINALSVGAQEGSGVDFTPMLEMAISEDIDNAAIYQIAYNTYSEKDKEKAIKYLEMGREKYPDNAGLLFAEINRYISEGKLELLIDKLKQAIEKEPENATVYGTLGNVYDQLYTKANEANDEAKANDYFENAKKYYMLATEKDPNSFSSYYGVGALYFNKAAQVGKELNAIGNDFSDAAIKKYDALKAEMQELYKESFPYLESAEKINPEDPLILKALQEYYVRIGEMDKSNTYKQKLEALRQK